MPLHIIHDDLTSFSADAIVNSTDIHYRATGGLDLALQKAAGEGLAKALAKLPPLTFGGVQVTEGFSLPYRYILHTACPIYRGGDDFEEDALFLCYQNALKKAYDLGCESIAFPLIGTGALYYPRNSVMKLATAAIGEFLMEHDMTVFISVFDKRDFDIDRRLYIDLMHYIAGTYAEPRVSFEAEEAYFEKRHKPRAGISAQARANMAFPIAEVKLEDLLKDMDAPFSETLFRLIDKKGISDVECYKRSNVDKKTFSKIKCNPDYRPSKLTVISFAIGLHLTIEETEALLKTVGLCLSGSSKFDVIIRYFLTTGNYQTIFDVNEVLYQFDEMTLGC